MNGVVDSSLVMKIDPETMEQLRQLQDNLEIIMQAASDKRDWTDDNASKILHMKK